MPEFREDLDAFLQAFGIQNFLYAAQFAKQQWPDAATRDAFIASATKSPAADSLANQGAGL